MDSYQKGVEEHHDCHEHSLHTLLSSPIDDWRMVYDRIQHYRHEARERYYRNESPLQLALKAREIRSCPNSNRGKSFDCGVEVNRIHVLQALVDADPSCIHSRDEEGRTCLHTACTAGLTEDILQWLIKEEECRQLRNTVNDMQSTNSEGRNVTLRTDYPGGALPLHAVAACSTFDCTSALADSSIANEDYINNYPIQCSITPNILSAYASTTVIRQMNPLAVLDRDCEGEIPLHAAASWGNVGSVLSLLFGAAETQSTFNKEQCRELAKVAALTEDDRKKTPLDRACQRVAATCVHVKKTRNNSMASMSSFRRSINRDDPFEASNNFGSNSEGRRSLLRSSRTGSGRRRIPGCGSSFRASISSSFVGLDFDDNDQDNDDQPGSVNGASELRASFVSPRRPIHPVRGLQPLDSDGDEEIAKVEMLARAACGYFEVLGTGNEDANAIKSMGLDAQPLTQRKMHPETLSNASKTVDCFQLLHATITLGCPPEIVWHSAAKNPNQVEEKDSAGRVPLFLASERLVSLYSRLLMKEDPTEIDGEESEDDVSATDAAGHVDTNSEFVESLLLGGDPSVKLGSATFSVQSDQRTLPPSSPESSSILEKKETPGIQPSTNCNDNATKEEILLTLEVMNMLLHSPNFGQSEMASMSNDEGRLALHIVLEAGVQWLEDDLLAATVSHDLDMDPQPAVGLLVEAYPRALETKDSLSGLYPFMIAAASTRGASNEVEEECPRQLETVYQLLLKAPNAIGLCL